MSSFLRNKEGNKHSKHKQENSIPDIEEFLTSTNDNIFLNESFIQQQKQNSSPNEGETDEHKTQDNIEFLNIQNSDDESDEVKNASEPTKKKSNIRVDPKFKDIVSTSINLYPNSPSKSYTMTNPDHRYRTFCEIVLVAHHPNYLRNISDFNFIKEIGKGGYGAVWLADDMRTGNQCAIKELYVEELKGKILTNFLREIHAMIIGQGKFICPIIGYTIEPPYSIITQYMSGGDLYHAVHNLDKKSKTRVKPRVYGTHLTIICMCIAHALRHIHRKGIIHRDVKPGNVLLDGEGMPHLVDFGVSRLIHPENRHSRFVGTVSHMAPEVISSSNYGTKADVFSYAILLFEVGERRHAFHNASKHAKEISQRILRGERPLFSADAIPTAMRNLIVKCWSQNPAERPSFDKIFQIFCEGKTFFKGSSSRKIVKFAQKLIKEDEAEFGIPPQMPTNINITGVLNRLMRKLTQVGPLDKTLVEQQNREKKKAADTIVEKMIQKPTIFERIMNNDIGQIPLQKVEDDDGEPLEDDDDSIRSQPNIGIKSDTSENDHFSYPNLMQKSIQNSSQIPAFSEPLPIFISEKKDKEIGNNSGDSQYAEFIEFQLSRIAPSQFDAVSHFIIPSLTSPNDSTKKILAMLKDLAEKDADFLVKYNQYHIVTSVMLSDEGDPYENELFDLLALVFIKKPALLGQMYTRVLAYFINKRPKATICLFSSYVDSIETINDPFPILDFLLSYARVYINIPSGALFIDLFFYLTSQYPEYKVQRFAGIKPIFTAFMRSSEKAVALEAIKAICYLYDDSFKVNVKTLINYIRAGSRATSISASLSDIGSFFTRGNSDIINSKSLSSFNEMRISNSLLIDEKLRDVSLSLIERLPSYPISNLFVQEIALLIDIFPTKATNILLKFADQSLVCAQYLLRRTDLWMDTARSGNDHNSFNLFLAVFKYQEIRNRLIESPEFPALLTSVIRKREKTFLEAITIIFKRVKISEQIVDGLEKAGFYTELAKICTEFCKEAYKTDSSTKDLPPARRSSGLEYQNQSKGLQEKIFTQKPTIKPPSKISSLESEDSSNENSNEDIPKSIFSQKPPIKPPSKISSLESENSGNENSDKEIQKSILLQKAPIKPPSKISSLESENSCNENSDKEIQKSILLQKPPIKPLSKSSSLESENSSNENSNEEIPKSILVQKPPIKPPSKSDSFESENSSNNEIQSRSSVDPHKIESGNIAIEGTSRTNLTNSDFDIVNSVHRRSKAKLSTKKQRSSTYGVCSNFGAVGENNAKTRAIPVAAMVIIEASSKVKYVPEYKLFVPMLLNQLPLQNEMTAAAIHTLTVLSFHQELKPVLNKPVLLNYFSQLKQFKAQKKYAITFLFNLLKKT